MAIACAGTFVWGQTRVNTQSANRVTNQVNTRTNTQLYGGSGGVGTSVRYSGRARTSDPLPSEWRHAYWKSGALPSDVRMGYAALGPMDPRGPMAYIPPKPSYLQKSNSAPAPAPMRPQTYSNQSVRYSTPSPNAVTAANYSRALPPTQVSGALLPSSALTAGQSNAGSVRYAR